MNAIKWLGHTRVMLHSDNENMMNSLICAALQGLRIGVVGMKQATCEDSVPYDPQTNGAAESAARLMKGPLRALRVTFEVKLQSRESRE